MTAFPDEPRDDFYYNVGRKKPSPFSKAFDRTYFGGLFDGIKKSLSVKALLATEQRIPGLGNGVLQDILFNARIHPKRKAESLSDNERDMLYHATVSTLKKMRDSGGRDTEKDLFGKEGGYRTVLSSKTLMYPCRVCGGGLKREAFLGGNIYFCPVCQPFEVKTLYISDLDGTLLSRNAELSENTVAALDKLTDELAKGKTMKKY